MSLSSFLNLCLVVLVCLSLHLYLFCCYLCLSVFTCLCFAFCLSFFVFNRLHVACVCFFLIFYASVVHFISPLFSHLSSLTPSVRIAFRHFLCPHILYVTSRPFLFCYVTHSLPWQSMSSLHAFLYSSILFDSLLYSNLVSPALHFYSSFVPFPPCAIFPCTPQFSFQ